MNARIIAALVAAIGGLGGCAGPDVPERPRGPSVEHRPPEIGFTAELTGGTYKLAAVDGRALTFRTGDRSVTLVSGFFPMWNLQGRKLEIEEGRLSGVWPLRVGRTASMQVTEEKTDYTYVLEAAVMAREQVTVPAGTFDAYRIHFDQRALIGPPFKASSQIWYAPELGVPVKRKRLRSTTEAGNPDFELVAYTPASEA